MSDEQIGFHKGSIQTLLAEKAELIKMISNVDNIINAHNEALKQFNIDYVKELQKMQEQAIKEQQKAVKEAPKKQPSNFSYREPRRSA